MTVVTREDNKAVVRPAGDAFVAASPLVGRGLELLSSHGSPSDLATCPREVD